MRKLKIIRRPVRHVFLGHKLLDELRILMRLASSSNARVLTALEGKSLKSL